MHRIRQGLPYLRQLGWEPVVITVDESYIESYSIDAILLETIPSDIEIHKVKAFPVEKTRKFGLGSLSMRSYFHIKKKGDELLKTKRFDLVYFSTTAFHVMALGPGWKRKFQIPFVLDIQDPWRNDFYLDKPKTERPPKFFISYQIDKYLEAYTVPQADGIISVSKGYIDSFLHRYRSLKWYGSKVIPFGAAEKDMEIMKNRTVLTNIQLLPDKINLLYIGRGGYDLQFSLKILFEAFKQNKQKNPELFEKFQFTFIGTSYAPKGKGIKTIEPIAKQFGLDNQVMEITDRISYFESLHLLTQADILVVPGSTDLSYTASKIYPYLLTEKPLLSIFYEGSSVVDFLRDMKVEGVITFKNESSYSNAVQQCRMYLTKLAKGEIKYNTLNHIAFYPYSAFSRTKEQVAFFDEIVSNYRSKYPLK
jgi:hypothetical protein